MRRREFIMHFGAAAATLPLAVRAQQPAMPVVGFVWYGSAAEWAPFVTTFRQGLKEIGFIEGQNLAIEFHWTQGQNDQQTAVAADLVRRQMAVIVTGTIGGLAAKAATTTIPIVFVVGADPVKTGLVTSLNRPGANVTGVSFFSNELMAKRLGLLHELLPQASMIAVLLNPSFPDADDQLKVLQGAAGTLGLHIFVVNASNDSEIGRGFATIAQRRVHALIVAADPFFTSRRDHIIALANRHSVPAIYDLRNWPTAGGLISYGTDVADAFRQTGIYTGKILKGTQPADLPVMQSTKYELVINLKTAKALGLEIPPMLLARADEVIE
jgi:putative tryptophan/tyrosine transport system substrate-binding protein